MERHPGDGQPGEQLAREVEAGGRRRCRAGLVSVDGLVAAGIRERLADVRRQRRLAGGLALDQDAPAAVGDRLTSSTTCSGAPAPSLSPARNRREGRASASQSAVDTFQQQHLDRAAGRAPQPQARRA